MLLSCASLGSKSDLIILNVVELFVFDVSFMSSILLSPSNLDQFHNGTAQEPRDQSSRKHLSQKTNVSSLVPLKNKGVE